MMHMLRKLTFLFILASHFSLVATTYFAVENTLTQQVIVIDSTGSTVQTISIGLFFDKVFTSAGGTIGGVAGGTVKLFNPLAGTLIGTVTTDGVTPFSAGGLTFTDDGATAFAIQTPPGPLFQIDTATLLATDTGVTVSGSVQVSGDGSVVCCQSSTAPIGNSGLILY